ncbi:SIMPL domain-containing protein [Methylobacter sp. S3L5C]|uniref:SIMPL domain-containing protein n=1 Tax=Methylobacter sp. S3L5C TaxID=2839024 RepID=UPI001FAD657A|nr:SIMPL domain-containing protein [Methylobacter sp. S3L5C]UOA09051.1 SIMPL domain-containing protein [Methylobacter sp. S3L5C]
MSLISFAQAEGIDHNRPHSIQVNGMGRVSIAPDKADLTLAIEIQAKSAEIARDQAGATMAALLKAIKESSVADKDIQTHQVSLYPIYKQDAANKINGYQLANSVTICVRDISKVSTIIDSAITAGGNAVRLQTINFAIDNPEAALAQAREKAYSNAHAKAEQYAKLAGITLGRIMHITEGNSMPPMPVPYAEMSVMRKATSTDNSTPIQAGEQEVSVTAEVIFGTE